MKLGLCQKRLRGSEPKKTMRHNAQRFVFLQQLVALALLSMCLRGFVKAATSLPKPVKLVRNFYKVHNTCHDAENYIRHQVKLFWDKDKSITPKLLRLLYSDCFVTVSVLFSSTSTNLFSFTCNNLDSNVDTYILKKCKLDPRFCHNYIFIL